MKFLKGEKIPIWANVKANGVPSRIPVVIRAEMDCDLPLHHKSGHYAFNKVRMADGKIVDSVMPEWVKAQMRTVLDKVNKVEQSGPVIHGLGGQWRNDPRMSADNKIRDIAKVLTEDIRINNGLILESHFDYMQILQIRNLIKSGNFPEEVMKTRIDINSDPPDSGPKRELWYDEVQRISRIRDALRNEAFSLGNLDIDTNEFIFPPENEERIKFLLGKANELEKMYPNMFAEWGEHGRLD